MSENSVPINSGGAQALDKKFPASAPRVVQVKNHPSPRPSLILMITKMLFIDKKKSVRFYVLAFSSQTKPRYGL